MSASARVTHATSNRLRLQVPERRRDSDYFAHLATRLAGLAEVEQVVVNPATAGILIHHHGLSVERLASFGSEQGLFDLHLATPEQHPLWQGAAALGNTLDQQLQRSSSGQVDLRSIGFLVLVAMALVQFSRGQILAPASTLIWYASDLLRQKQ